MYVYARARPTSPQLDLQHRMVYESVNDGGRASGGGPIHATLSGRLP